MCVDDWIRAYDCGQHVRPHSTMCTCGLQITTTTATQKTKRKEWICNGEKAPTELHGKLLLLFAPSQGVSVCVCDCVCANSRMRLCLPLTVSHHIPYNLQSFIMMNELITRTGFMINSAGSRPARKTARSPNNSSSRQCDGVFAFMSRVS